MGKIIVEIDGKEKEVPIKKNSARIETVLKSLSIYPETAVVIKEKELICEDETVKTGEKIKIVIATSKG